MKQNKIGVGEAVETDEIILEIETDKVSIEIRAPKSGYIAEFFAEVESDVAVGQKLYAISDEPIEGVDPSKISSKKTEKKETTNTQQTATQPSQTSQKQTQQSKQPTNTTNQSQSHRTPMIRFRYGKRGGCSFFFSFGFCLLLYGLCVVLFFLAYTKQLQQVETERLQQTKTRKIAILFVHMFGSS